MKLNKSIALFALAIALLLGLTYCDSTVEDNPTETNSTIYKSAEVMPSIIGGIKSLQDRIVYPELAKRAGIEGRVFVKAIIDKEGNVEKTELVKGIGAGCDETAMNAVKETKFTAATNNGLPVKVEVVVPIAFKLDNIKK